MPNCDFYATAEDHEPLLTRLFADAQCHVFELASDFEKPLTRFDSAAQVMQQFERRYPDGNLWTRVDLQLYVLGAGPPFKARRVTLDPSFCDGAKFRYAADGWGLVQLYLLVPRNGRLDNSHTNHNSEKRAKAWASVRDVEYGPEVWNFKTITAFSSRLNRAIRQRSVAKIGSRVVLPGAIKLWDQGMPLGPYVPGEHALQTGA